MVFYACIVLILCCLGIRKNLVLMEVGNFSPGSASFEPFGCSKIGTFKWKLKISVVNDQFS